MSVPIGSSWKLTFDDEFNGTAINSQKWNTNWLGPDGAITPPVNDEEIAAYDPKQVSVSGGLLHLNAIAAPVKVGGVSYQYRSGIVQTHDNFSQAYGYFEARINLSGSNGKIADWPGFWTDGEIWPKDGEMDIMEGLGGSPAYHFHSTGHGLGATVKGDYSGWHTYGALWEPGKVSFYYDNVLVGTITSGITSAPQYLILNLGIGVDSVLKGAAEMQVDWVHVYSNNSAVVAVAPEDGYTGPGGGAEESGGSGGGAGTHIVNGTSANNKLKGTIGTDQLNGLAGNDTLLASSGNDVLNGGDGNDTMRGDSGNDVLDGGNGKDSLIGGTGADILSGGSGADVFRFGSLGDSSSGNGTYDTITDFSHAEGDRLVLADIDANTHMLRNQAFRFIGTSDFSHHAGELRYEMTANGIIVYGDVNGDGTADLTVALTGVSSIAAGDFVL